MSKTLCPQLADLLKHLVIPAKCLRETAAEMTGCLFQHINKTFATVCGEPSCDNRRRCLHWLELTQCGPNVCTCVTRSGPRKQRSQAQHRKPSLRFSTFVLRKISSPDYMSELSQVQTSISDITSLEVKSPSCLNPLQP